MRVTARDGRLLGYIHLPIYGGEPKRQICATNVAFGGRDGRDLYVTACEVVFRLRVRQAVRIHP